VGGEAGADDEYALVAQGAEPLAEGEQVAGVLGGQAELQHGHVGQRVHGHQGHPGAVVEPAADVLVHRGAVRHPARTCAASAEASGVG